MRRSPLRFSPLLLALSLIACADDAPSDPDLVVSRVGPTGATLVSSDGAFEVRIPAGALTSEVEISIRRVPAAEWPPETASAPPVGEVYELLPEGIRFEAPVRVVHRVPAGALEGSTPTRRPAATHRSRTSGGRLERHATTTVHRRSGGAVVIGRTRHFSSHWATTQSDLGAIEVELAYAEGDQPLDESRFGVDSLALSVGEAGDHEVDLVLGAHSSAPEIVAPLAFEGWTYLTDEAEIAEALGAAFEGAPLPVGAARSDAVTTPITGGAEPTFIDAFYPSFHCAAEGTGRGWYEVSLADHEVTVLVEAEFTCAEKLLELEHDGQVTSAAPGAFAPFTADAARFSSPYLTEGLDYAVVASGSDAQSGTIEIVDLTSGARIPGPVGVAIADLALLRDVEQREFVYAATDAGVRGFEIVEDTEVRLAEAEIAAPTEGSFSSLDVTGFDEAGVPGFILATQRAPLAFIVMSPALGLLADIAPDSFDGAAFPSQAGHAVVGPFGGYLAVFDGVGYEGPLRYGEEPAEPASPLSFSPEPTSTSQLRCADHELARFCALVSAADRRIWLFSVGEIVEHIATIDTVGEPYDPAIHAQGETVDSLSVSLAVPTSHATFEMFTLDASLGEVVTHAPASVSSCEGARHARFNGDLYATCRDTDNLVRVKLAQTPFPVLDI